LWHQAEVGEADFCPNVRLEDIEDDLGLLPFSLVLDEIEVIVNDEPCNSAAGHEIRDPDRAAVNVSVSVNKLTTDFVCYAIDTLGTTNRGRL
jgi:hypothetical protein